MSDIWAMGTGSRVVTDFYSECYHPALRTPPHYSPATPWAKLAGADLLSYKRKKHQCLLRIIPEID